MEAVLKVRDEGLFPFNMGTSFYYKNLALQVEFDETTVSSVMAMLVREGKAVRVKRGHYAFCETSHASTVPFSLPSVVFGIIKEYPDGAMTVIDADGSLYKITKVD